MTAAPDFNAVVSVREGAYTQARALLGELGRVQGTAYYNVLTLDAADLHEAMEALRIRCSSDPSVMDWLGHFTPVEAVFAFQSPGEFESRARETLLQWLPRLAGRRFHVRMHRRGFKGRMEGPAEERLLGSAIVAALEAAGTPARVAFDDPDAIVLVETIGQQAGLALLTRELLRRYPFIGPQH